MGDSEVPRWVGRRHRFDWEEKFYDALSGARDPEKWSVAEWIVFERMRRAESTVISDSERSAIDDCLLVLRSFQVRELKYPPIPAETRDKDSRSESSLIEREHNDHTVRLPPMHAPPRVPRKSRIA